MNTPTRKATQSKLIDGGELSLSPLQSTPKSSRLDSPYTSSPEYMCGKESYEFEIIWDGNSPQRTVQKSRSKNYKTAISRSRVSDVKNHCPFRRKRNTNDINFFKQKFEKYLMEMAPKNNNVPTNSNENIENINFEHFFDNDDFFDNCSVKENQATTESQVTSDKKGVLPTISEIREHRALDDSFDLLMGTIDDETLYNFSQVETGSQAVVNNNVLTKPNKISNAPVNTNGVSSVQNRYNVTNKAPSKANPETVSLKNNEQKKFETETKFTKNKFSRSESSGNLGSPGNGSKNFQYRNRSFPTSETIDNKYALEKDEIFTSTSSLNDQDNPSTSIQCTPEEIERKRLKALEKFKKNLLASQNNRLITSNSNKSNNHQKLPKHHNSKDATNMKRKF